MRRGEWGRRVPCRLLAACLLTASPAGLLVGTTAGLRAQAGAADTSGAGRSAPAGELRGLVVSSDGGLPVAGAEILVPSGVRAVTDSAGRFRIAGLEPGRLRFDLRLPELPSRTLEVGIEAGSVTRVVLRVSPRIVPAPVLDVVVRSATTRKGKLAGFYRRRARGIGAFIDRDEIERRDPREVSDLLRSVPGIDVAPGPGSTGRIEMSRSSGVLAHRDCRVAYFVDGLRIPPENAFHLDELSPRELEAIEVYRGVSEVPAIFLRTGEECGVVAVWTRDPSRP